MSKLLSLGHVARPSFGAGSVLMAISALIERNRQRAALKRLDAHQMDDLGLSREDIASELNKPFWRA